MLLNMSNNGIDDSVANLPQSIQHLIQSLSSRRYLTPQLARQFILSANIQPEDLSQWETYNHPIVDSYGRKLVYDGGYFEIMVMSWMPGDFSAIHDHGFTQWGAVQCFGTAKHITYQLKDHILQTDHEMWFKPRQVVTVNHDLIHQMGNPSEQHFLSLHVYGCSDRFGDITSDARIFDLWEGSIQYTNGGVFFCLADSEISQRQLGLQGDLSTTLRHHQQMLNRINKILQNTNCYSLQWQLKAELVKQKINELNLIINHK